MFVFSDKNKISMKFYGTLAYIVITLVYCPYLSRQWHYLVENDAFALLYVTIATQAWKRWITRKESFFKTSYTIFFRTYSVIFKSFIYSKNILVIKFKKLFFFIFNVLLIDFILFLKKFLKMFFDKFVFWKPLFKRQSYISFYKNFVSKFSK